MCYCKPCKSRKAEFKKFNKDWKHTEVSREKMRIKKLAYWKTQRELGLIKNKRKYIREFFEFEVSVLEMGKKCKRKNKKWVI